jgi:starch synthase
LKYGTVPVVRAVGGQDDTVKEFTPRTGKGNGFKFKPFEVKYFLAALRKAVASFKNKLQWQSLMLRGMSENHSWNKSAEKYEHLYNMTLKIKQPKKK